jgi:hypothetical protein
VLPEPVAGAHSRTTVLVVLMVVQSALGLTFTDQYRDVEWIRTTWLGNDWVTLLVAAPLLILGNVAANRRRARGLLLWLGVTAYAAYNYAFYLFGAALNPFFPLYVTLVVLAAVILIDVVSASAGNHPEHRFHSVIPEKVLAGYFVGVGAALAIVWIGIWAAFVFFGRPTPVEPEAFRLVAALDLTVLVPVLTLGGTLLWRKSTWGVFVAAIGGVQASLYLLVLSVNAVIAVSRGLVTAPGEVPVWIALLTVTLAATLAVFAGVREEAAQTSDGFAWRHV